MYLQSHILNSRVIQHGFFGRAGGVSLSPYDSLNIGFGSQDARADVQQNRVLAMQALRWPEQHLVTVTQVHSADVVDVTEIFDSITAPHADALVTRIPGIMLGIQTADCAPVLFADPVARVIGAAHAGWKGALAGVLEATITAMIRLGADPQSIQAAIGPCIHQPSYEVDTVFYQTFMQASAAYQTFFADTEQHNKFLFDLAGFVRFRLYNTGVMQIDDLEQDTLSQPQAYFSFRRSTLQGDTDYGRQLSCIGLV